MTGQKLLLHMKDHSYMYKMLQILQWCPRNPSVCMLCAVNELDVLCNVMHVQYLMLSTEGLMSRQVCVVWL
jgi:hypothetical protein